MTRQKNVNMNVQWMWVTNLWAYSNLIQVDMSLKSVYHEEGIYLVVPSLVKGS